MHAAPLPPGSGKTSFARRPYPGWSVLVITAIAGALVWAIAQWIASPNLDRYHDMLESYAWSQTFEWGTFKHPPLFAWVTGLWFGIFPRGDFSFKLLAYANVAIGLLGVAALARSLGLGRYALATVILLLICLPYSTLAAKFNANSQLLSVWPWAAAALIGSINHSGARGWWWSTLLGLLAALAMLGKYYSGVLLVALFVAALSHEKAMRWFASPRPWWALSVAVVALTPHAIWLRNSGFVLLGYALDQGGGGTHWGQLRVFALIPFLYWLPGWWLAAAVFALQSPRGTRLATWFEALFIAWRPLGWRDPVFYLAFMPWAVSLAFGIAGVVELSSPWAIPIGFAFPILWLRNLSRGRADDQTHRAVVAISSPRMSVIVGGGILVLATGLAVVHARSGAGDYYRPTENAAKTIASGWHARYPETPLGWSAGAWPDNAMMPFYADPKIRALPSTPDSRESAVAPHPLWSRQGGVLICPLGPALHAQAEGDQVTECERQIRAWLTATGRAEHRHDVIAHRQGWRFPHPQAWRYAVFDVLPEPYPAGRTR